MSAVRPRFGEGRALSISYTPNEAISGGQLVQRINGTRLVEVADAGSLKVAGVALQDALAAPVSPDQIKVADELGLTVVRGCVVAVTFAAAANPGEKLIAAANGQVTPAGATPDAATLVGEAFDGVALGAVGLAVIY